MKNILGLNRKELSLVLGLWVILITLTGIPYLKAYKQAPPGQVFTGNFNPFNDFNNHYMFIRQSAEGRWLFKNRNTPEPHNPDYFHLEFLLIGKIAAATGMSIEAAFHVGRILGSLALIIAFFLLARLYFPDFKIQAWMLFFYCLGNGFGWLSLVINWLRGAKTFNLPLDITSEIHPFNQIFFTSHSTWANALNIMGMYWFLKGLKSNKPGAFWLSGAIIFLTGLFRPYGLVFFCAFVGLWCLIRLSKKQLSKPEFVNYCYCLCLPTIVLIYNVILFKFHPVFRWWGLQNGVKTPNLTILGLALGLPFIMALFEIVRRDYSKPIIRSHQVLYLWLGLIFVLLYSHRILKFAFQLSPLMTAPIYLLAGGVLFKREDAFSSPKPLALSIQSAKAKLVIFGLILVFSSLTSVFSLFTINKIAVAGNAYLESDWLEASSWINRNTPKEARFIASFYSGSYLTHYTNKIVFLGHNHTTIDFKNKLRQLNQFLSWKDPVFNYRLLKSWRIDYYWEDRYLAKRMLKPRKDLSYLKEIFRNQAVIIYRIL